MVAMDNRQGSTKESKDSDDDIIACDSPTSLMNICIDFVATNIHFVESLVDFPEVVGKSLFERAEKKGLFSDYRSANAVRSLQLFSYAYGDLLIDNLNIENTENEIEDLLPVISSVVFDITKLNLDCCGLGSKDDLLQHISSLKTLQNLSLRANGLTDTSLRILTSPMRILKRGATNIQILDLSRNPRLSEASARYLLCFHRLEAIDLSGTGYFCWGIQKLEDNLGLEEDSDMEQLSITHTCLNRGWAAEVFNLWSNPVEDEESTEVLSFYGKINASRFAAKIRPKKKAMVLPPADPVIRLRTARMSSNLGRSVTPETLGMRKKRRILTPSELLKDNEDPIKSASPKREKGERCPPALKQSILDCYAIGSISQPSNAGSCPGQGEKHSLDSLLNAEEQKSNRETLHAEHLSAETISSKNGIDRNKDRQKKRRKIVIKRRIPDPVSSVPPVKGGCEVESQENSSRCKGGPQKMKKCLVTEENKVLTVSAKKKPSNLFAAMNSNQW